MRDLSSQERAAIAADPWFATLSPMLRHDILRRANVRRCPAGDVICWRGTPADAWLAVVGGAVRIGSMTPEGKQIALRYIEPGVWFGEVEMFDWKGRPHDVLAHGETALLAVGREDLQQILANHPELYGASCSFTRNAHGTCTDWWRTGTPSRCALAWHLAARAQLRRTCGGRWS